MYSTQSIASHDVSNTIDFKTNSTLFDFAVLVASKISSKIEKCICQSQRLNQSNLEMTSIFVNPRFGQLNLGLTNYFCKPRFNQSILGWMKRFVKPRFNNCFSQFQVQPVKPRFIVRSMLIFTANSKSDIKFDIFKLRVTLFQAFCLLSTLVFYLPLLL